MVSIAKITREDRNLTQDEDRVWEEMMQVLELETDIANVSVNHNQEKGFLDKWKMSPSSPLPVNEHAALHLVGETADGPSS